jgi:iron complex transport system substrate-binding protein
LYRKDTNPFLAVAAWVVALSAIVLVPGIASAGDQDATVMKRRQQGILTGMPFMANLASRTFVDDLSRKVYLAKAPARVLSLAPSITEILFAIGLADRIVGVTEFCDYPPEARAKPKVGYAQPNLESLVAFQPDLVLSPRDFMRADLISKLEQLKIPVFILEAKTIEDIASHIQLLGRMLGASDAADQVAMDLRRRLAALKARTEPLRKPRVLYVLNSQPLITVGPGSFVHHVIVSAGGTNVAEHAASDYPRLSMEEVIKQDPEVILFPVGSLEGISTSEQQTWRRWSTLSAVKREQFHQIPSDLLNRPGPRIVEGMEKLARILHPDAFQGVTP